MFENIKDLFEKNVPEHEKTNRFLRDGGVDAAINNYGDELAYQSADMYLQTDLTPEQEKTLETLRTGASNVINCFALKRSDDNKKGENLLIVTDAGADPLMLRALHEAGRGIAGDDCRVVVAPKTKHAAQEFGAEIGEKMKTADAVLLLTSLSRSHAKETVEVLHPEHSAEAITSIMESPEMINSFSGLRAYTAEELAAKLGSRKLSKNSVFSSKARFISITNTDVWTLTTGGALENPVTMKQRIDKFAEIMKGVEKVRVSSDNGTDLIVDLKVPTLIKETGIIEKPGQGSNFPSGEFGGAVDQNGTSGKYVIDGAIGMIGRVDQPVIVTIRQGLVIDIAGGVAAERLKQILTEANQSYRAKNPKDQKTDAFKTAEFSFGMNSKAFAYDERGKKISPTTSLEGEKGLGTIHLAFGKNSLFNVSKDDPDYNDIPIHIDCVAMQTSVTGIKDDDTEVEIIRKGEMIVI